MDNQQCTDAPDVVIFRVEPADWRLLKTIRLRALADAPDAFGTPLAKEEQQIDDFWKGRASNEQVGTYIAIRREAWSNSSVAGERQVEDCVGLITGAPCLHREGELREGAAGLYSMWVSPDARRMNVGKLLVERVKQWARSEEKYSKVLLIVADFNVPAKRLYESCGFIKSGIPFDDGSPLPEQEYSFAL